MKRHSRARALARTDYHEQGVPPLAGDGSGIGCGLNPRRARGDIVTPGLANAPRVAPG